MVTRVALQTLVTPPGASTVVDFTDGTHTMTVTGGSGDVQYDTGSSGSFATGRTFTLDSSGLNIQFPTNIASGKYAAAKYQPASAIDFSGYSQLVFMVDFPEWHYYCNLNVFCIQDAADTYTNYLNKAFGDGYDKAPAAGNVMIYNLSNMTQTGTVTGYLTKIATITKIVFRLTQTANGATALQPGNVTIKKVWLQ